MQVQKQQEKLEQHAHYDEIRSVFIGTISQDGCSRISCLQTFQKMRTCSMALAARLPTGLEHEHLWSSGYDVSLTR